MINQVTIVGRLTKDPVLRVTKEQKSVVKVVVAINRPFKNPTTGKNETDFVYCTLWGRLAENTVKYCAKGSLVGVIGRISSRFFENEEGKRTYMTEIFGESIQFLSSLPPKNTPTPDQPQHSAIPVRSLAEMK